LQRKCQNSEKTTAVILPYKKEWTEREYREGHYNYILRERDALNGTVTRFRQIGLTGSLSEREGKNRRNFLSIEPYTAIPETVQEKEKRPELGVKSLVGKLLEEP